MFCGIILFLVLCKIIAYYTCGKCYSKRRLEGKTIIVTGANIGLGKETVTDFAWRGAKVIMACRNITLANIARDEIISETGNKNIIVKQLDVSSLSSVREFAKDILASENRLDVLVHNAGIYNMKPQNYKSVDGMEMTLATNHFGPFLLTHLLMDLMKKSAPSRIVIVSSLAHFSSFSDLKDFDYNSLMTTSNYFNYSLSKRANVLFATELARRLKDTKVTVNCLHPGAVNTNIFHDISGFKYVISYIFKYLYFKSAEEGAQTQIYLSVADEVENISGKYFIDCVGFNAATSQSEILNANYLWDKSEEFVKLRPEEKISY